MVFKDPLYRFIFIFFSIWIHCIEFSFVKNEKLFSIIIVDDSQNLSTVREQIKLFSYIHKLNKIAFSFLTFPFPNVLL